MVFMNRKGSVSDAYGIIVQYVGILITILIVAYVFSIIFPAFGNSISSPIAKTVLSNSNTMMPNWIDSFFFWLYIGIILAAVILALFVNYNPLFMFLSIILYLLGGLISIISSKILNYIANVMPALFTNMPLLSNLTQHMVQYDLLALALIILAMYWNPIGNMGAQY